jgi:hypothetical protein
MNRVGAGAAGYTVVETMIFLAVSGAMFLSAMLFMGGQQRKNELATGIRDVQSQLIDIMNDVSTGFYNNSGTFQCQASGSSGKPTITAGSGEQGTNAGCTFVGKVIQFAPSDAGYGESTAQLYTLVGRRQTGTPGVDVRTIGEADPTILGQSDATVVLPYGIKIKRITYTGGSGTAGSLAFVSRFAQNSGSGGITGTQDIDLIPVSGTILGQLISEGKNQIETVLATSSRNPASGVSLCFDSGGTDQHADLLIGGPGRQISTQLTISSGGC